MNEPEGRAAAVKEGFKEGVGEVADEVKTKWARRAERAQGNVQDMYGRAQGNLQDMYADARDSVTDATYAAGRQAMSYEHTLRRAIQEQPYVAMAVALGIGIALGVMSGRSRSDDDVRKIYRYRI